MAEYSPSKIIKDGNTYNFRDTTKIPLAGSNEISGSLIPSTDGTVNFGSPSYQWNNAYIKSLTINGVAAGDILTHNASEFVDVSTAQTIGGVKTFSNIIYGLGSQIILRRNDVERTVLPASIVYTAFSFSDKNGAGTFSRFGAVENVVKTNGDINLDLRAYDFSVKSNTHTTVVLERKYDGTSSFYPEQNNTVNLGASTNKWKSFNGLNPGALSLPRTTGLIDISSSITSLDGVTINNFTPQVDGWLLINGTGVANDGFIYVTQGRIGIKSTNNASSNRCAALIPVVAGVQVSVTCKLSVLTWANIVPCQGNV